MEDKFLLVACSEHSSKMFIDASSICLPDLSPLFVSTHLRIKKHRPARAVKHCIAYRRYLFPWPQCLDPVIVEGRRHNHFVLLFVLSSSCFLVQY